MYPPRLAGAYTNHYLSIGRNSIEEVKT